MERRCRQKNPGCVANLNCFLTVSPVNDCGDENVFMSNICMSIVSDTIAKPDCFHIGIFPANLTTRRHNRADPSPRGWLSSPYRGTRIHPIALARRRGLRRSARGLARAETRAKGRAPAAVAEKNTGKRGDAAPARFPRLGSDGSHRRGEDAEDDPGRSDPIERPRRRGGRARGRRVPRAARRRGPPQRSHRRSSQQDATTDERAVSPRREVSLGVQGVQRVSPRSPALQVQRLRRGVDMFPRSQAHDVQGVRRRRALRVTREAAIVVQGVRRRFHLRARSPTGDM